MYISIRRRLSRPDRAAPQLNAMDDDRNKLLTNSTRLQYPNSKGSDDESEESDREDASKGRRAKQSPQISCLFAVGYLIFWMALFYGVVLPLFNRLPEGLTIEQETKNQEAFIAERAQKFLLQYSLIGPKVVGSNENENVTTALILEEIENIRGDMLKIFNMKVEVQEVSGAFMRSTVVNMYQGMQNIIVRLSPKNTSSESYLLVNSHFDSKPGSPGAGDDGQMMVAMLEVLRKMATTPQTFEHPIIFLFNGAEENGVQASHGFITKHKWAKFCKALINLDAAGNGGREILFQSGPNNPWLMKYYKKYAQHPFATTMAEEVFQVGIIPSNTDFRIFRDYGQVPGLDLAQCTNGYVYHTKYDSYDIIPRGSIQNTGDNLLGLVRGLVNASELYNTEEYAEGHAVFYDFLGLFLIYHTEAESRLYNYALAGLTLILIFVSLWRIASQSQISLQRSIGLFVQLLIVQIVGLSLALGLPLAMAYYLDSVNSSLSYFTNNWLIVGLYIIPTLIGIALPVTLYFNIYHYHKVSYSYKLQIVLHCHGTLIAVIALGLTYLSVRSAYLCSIALVFYVGALAFNLLTTLHDRGNAWIFVVVLSQILPFSYFCYVFHAFVVVMIPMMGRNGNSYNPDLLIGGLCALGSILAMGFLMPLINVFKRSKLNLTILAIIAVAFAYAATSTEIGFPYRARTNVERVDIQHVHRIFYEYDGKVSSEEYGYLLDFQNRRMEEPLSKSSVNLTGLQTVTADCTKHMMCGMPLLTSGMYSSRLQLRWLPREAFKLPGTMLLEMQSKHVVKASGVMRFKFRLTGPPHMSIFINPLEDVEISDWSFIRNMLDDPSTYKPPYHIYFCYGNDKSALEFKIDIKKTNQDYNVPLFELGVSGHFISASYNRDSISQKFINDFPDYVYIMEWPSTYERYIF